MTEHKVDELVIDGKNGVTIKCKHCPSVILTPASAAYTSIEFDLPLEAQPKPIDSTASNNIIQTEPMGASWAVDDMYAFHNVGFSTTVENTKYLVCADCELGPIGYHDLSSKKSYVAVNRVEHVPVKPELADAIAITAVE